MDYTGRLLIAHPMLENSFFERSVVYIYEYSKRSGAIGVVLNKATNFQVKNIFEQKNYNFNGYDLLFQGGPVSPKAVVMLHSHYWYSKNTLPLGELSVSSDSFMIEKMSTGNVPDKWRMFVGLSAWAPGQLEAEIAGTPPYKLENRWLTAKANPEIVFDYDGDEQWNRAVELCSQEMIDHYF